MNTQTGFSLIELMITLSIAALTLTLAVPAFHSAAVSNQVATSVNEFVSGISIARGEAVKRSAKVRLEVIDSDAGWSGGWRTCVDTNDDGDCEDDDDEELRVGRPSSSTISVENDDSLSALVFDSRGGVGSPASFTISPQDGDCPEGANGKRTLSLTISGHPSVTTLACVVEEPAPASEDSEGID